MPEFFIGLYSNFFKITKREAEKKIKDTPLKESGDSNDFNS